MKLDSKQCRMELESYEAVSDMEKLAVKVLLTKDEDVVKIPGIEDMTDAEMDDLASIIRVIRKDIGIEEEA